MMKLRIWTSDASKTTGDSNIAAQIKMVQPRLSLVMTLFWIEVLHKTLAKMTPMLTQHRHVYVWLSQNVYHRKETVAGRRTTGTDAATISLSALCASPWRLAATECWPALIKTPTTYMTSLGLKWVCEPPQLTQSAQQQATMRVTGHKCKLYTTLTYQHCNIFFLSASGWSLESS